MADVFVSYATEDRERVEPIVQAIEQAGISVWWDRRIAPGAGFDAEIQAALDTARCVLVIWSKHSVTSEWVITESNEGLERGILVPVSFDDVRPPLAFRRRQTIAAGPGKDSHEHVIAAVRGMLEGKAVELPQAVHKPAPNTAPWWGVSGLIVGALALYIAIGFTQSSDTANLVRADLILEGWVDWRNLDNPAASMAISPDGTTVVYVARGDSGFSRLRVRHLDSSEVFDIDGTRGAEKPFFSPDGRWIGYFQDRLMKRMSLTERKPSIVATLAQEAWGASWGMDDRIVYAEGRSGLKVVPINGGEPTELTSLNASRGEGSHRTPHHVRGTSVLLFTVLITDKKTHEVWALDLESDKRAYLADGLAAAYTASGHIVYTTGELSGQGSLWSLPFDPNGLNVTGAPVSVQTSVAGREGSAFAVAYNGPLVYLPSPGESLDQLVLLEPSGAERVLATGDSIVYPRFSHDGSKIVFSGSLRAGQRSSVWVYQLNSDTLSRFSDGMAAIWGPEDRTIVYSVAGLGMMRQGLDSVSEPEMLVEHISFVFPHQWLDGGSTLLYNPVYPEAVAEIRTLKPGAAPEVLTNNGEMQPSVTNDQQWMAFCTYPSGVMVGRFPAVSAVVEVSNSGCAPKWGARDDRLYYVEFDKLWSADVRTVGAEIAFGEKRLVADLGGPGWPSHDSHESGHLIYVRRIFTSPKPSVIVMNWERLLE